MLNPTNMKILSVLVKIYRTQLRTQLDHLASLAKWLSVRLRTKWFWVRVQLQKVILERIKANEETNQALFSHDIRNELTGYNGDGQQIMQDFKSVSDHFGTLCIKGLKLCPSFNPKFHG